MKKLLPLIVFLCLTVPVFGQGFANGNGYNNGLTGGGNVGISTATALQSATTVVNVSAATAPTNGQVLTATGATAATWQTPSASGSNYWKLSTGNVGINTTYNVGIGSTNPGQALDVQGTIRTIGFSMGGVTSTTVTGTGANVFATSPTLTTPNLGTPSAINLSNATGTATNVSVGTASALNSATTIVSVSGAAAPTSGQVLTATGSTAATWQTPSASTSYWIPGNVGINTTSNVGIGTVNPGQALDVNGTIRAIAYVTGTGSASITGNGANVGIGSTAAGTALDVNGTVRMTGFTLTGQGAANGNVLVGNNVGIGTWMAPSTIGVTGGNGTNYWLNGGQTVGIGTVYPVGVGSTAPGGMLDVEGTLPVVFNATTASLPVNVGIGSFAPGVKLDINGTARVSGAFISTSSANTTFGTNVGVGTSNALNLLQVYGGSVGIGTIASNSTMAIGIGTENQSVGEVVCFGTGHCLGWCSGTITDAGGACSTCSCVRHQ